jgi:hypothetical protein
MLPGRRLRAAGLSQHRSSVAIRQEVTVGVQIEILAMSKISMGGER